MKLVSIKAAKEAGLEALEFIFVDKQIVEVIIGDLHIRKGESYSKALEVLISAPNETVEKWRLTAVIEGFPAAVSYHDSRYDAESAGNKFEDRGAKTVIERVDVIIDEDSNIVDDTNDLPF